MSFQYKHITEYRKWIRIMENEETGDLESMLDSINSDFNRAAHGNLTTREFMNWFHRTIELYDSSEETSLVFEKMKDVFQKNFNKIQPITRKANPELTTADKLALTRYKKIAADEATFARAAQDRLKDLGFI